MTDAEIVTGYEREVMPVFGRPRWGHKAIGMTVSHGASIPGVIAEIGGGHVDRGVSPHELLCLWRDWTREQLMNLGWWVTPRVMTCPQGERPRVTEWRCSHVSGTELIGFGTFDAANFAAVRAIKQEK